MKKNLEKLLNNYFKNIVSNKFFDTKQIFINDEVSKLIRKFIFDNYITWYDEINKRNKDSKEFNSINDFKTKENLFIYSLSNEKKFEIFIEEFLHLTTRLFKYLNDYELQKVKNLESEENLIKNHDHLKSKLQKLEYIQYVEYDKQILNYEKDFNYCDNKQELKDLQDSYQNAKKEYLEYTDSNKILVYRNYLNQENSEYLKIKFKNIIPKDARTKLFKDYYIRLRYLSQCFNMRKSKIFLLDESLVNKTKFFNFLPIQNKNERLSWDKIDKNITLTKQDYSKISYADLYCPKGELSVENFFDDFLISD